VRCRGLVLSTPVGVSDQEAAAVALTGITAHLGLFRCARLEAGETVFVNGGTGGVGSMVVQEAKAVGAKVIATVGSQEKAALCQSWGADCVLNYKTDDVPARVKDFTKGQGVNVWYETQREPDFIKTVDLLAWRGRMIITAAARRSRLFPSAPSIPRTWPFTASPCSRLRPRSSMPARSTSIAGNGEKLRAVIGKTFPIREAAAAHRFLEENTLQRAGTLTGKVVLTIE